MHFKDRKERTVGANEKREAMKICVSYCRAALTDGEDITASAVSPDVLNFAKKQDILHLVSVGARRLGTALPEEVKNTLFHAELLSVSRYQKIFYEYRAVSDAFEAAGIFHIPLKGAVIRDLYPEPWYRTSCDVDIFVKEEDLPSAISLLQERGYTAGVKSVHDVCVLAPSGLHIELHFSLAERKGEKEGLFSHLFDEVSLAEGRAYEYRLSNEMLYCHHLDHTLRHFARGGTAIRAYFDIFLMRKKLSFNEERLAQLLSLGGLTRFHEVVSELVSLWFLNGEESPLLSAVETYLAIGMMYCKTNGAVYTEYAHRGGKKKGMLSYIFLSYPLLCEQYPSLRKTPFLLPFYEVRRWLRILFRGNLKKNFKTAIRHTSVGEEYLAAHDRFLSLVGASLVE